MSLCLLECVASPLRVKILEFRFKCLKIRSNVMICYGLPLIETNDSK